MNSVNANPVQKSMINTLIDSSIAVGIATIINSIIYLLAAPFSVQLPDGNVEAVVLAHILGASIVPPIIAGIFLWLLRHFLKQGTLVFQVIAVVMLIGSLYNPISMAESMSIAAWLSLMHSVVGSATIWALTIKE